MKNRKQLTDQEREQRRADQQQLVKDSIEQLRSSDGWQAWLHARRSFRSYSLGNVLLIQLQHPTATTVAGFGAWLKLGYSVQRGQQSIKIWAPCPPSRKRMEEWRKAGADPDQKPRTFWKLASVFAQDQVQELPPPAVPAPLQPPIAAIEGDSHQDLIGRLVDLAGEIGYRLTFGDSPRGDGSCNPKTKLITVASSLSPNGQLATLIHELGHAALADEPDTRLDYAQEELVVESISVCVCQTIGLSTLENSIPYLASWAESASVEILEQTAQLTDRVARRIEDRLLAETATVKPTEEHPVDTAQPVAA